MKNLTGWQVVAVVGLFLSAFCILVALGQDVGALIAAGLVILGALGVPIYQNAVNSEKINQGNMLANGNLKDLREQLTTVLNLHAEQLAEKDRLIQQAHEQAVQLATMVSPDTKIPEGLNGQ